MNMDYSTYNQSMTNVKVVPKKYSQTNVMGMEQCEIGGSEKYMDKLPTVMTCCFCCFLRGGTICIAIVSFIIGLILSPNVRYDMSNTAIETGSHLLLGIMSILLCVFSALLLVGALYDIPILIECYQWGAVVYCIVTVMIYVTLSIVCFGVISNCMSAGFFLLIFAVCNVLLTAYFVIVVNSLRLVILYLNSTGFNIKV